MQRSFKQSCLFTLGLSILFTSILFAQSKPSLAQRWEYFSVQACNDAALNKYGDEGWELAVVTDVSGSCPKYSFKRLKPVNAPKYIDPQAPPLPKANAPTCNLPLAQAPTIRGLRLGMSVDDLIELFPGANPNEFKGKVEQAKGEPSLGHLYFGFSGTQHKERIEGQTFNLTLFDDKVTSFRIEYSFYNQAQGIGRIFNGEQLKQKLIETFNLPAKEYWQESGDEVNLRCSGFWVNGDFGAKLILSLSAPPKETQEKTEQRRNEALAKKRAEFKP